MHGYIFRFYGSNNHKDDLKSFKHNLVNKITREIAHLA